MPIPLRLTVQSGDQEPEEHRFERDIVKIGRLASAHLKLEDNRVSRIHAVIEAGSDGQDYAIIDMGSTEGTQVNGRKISKERLADGDTIVIGPYTVAVGYGDAQAAVAPSPAAEAVPMGTGDVLAAQPDPATPPGPGAPAPEAIAPPAPGAPAASGVFPGHPAASGVYPAPNVSGAFPAGAPAASGVYPAPNVSGAFPAGAPAASGVYPAPPVASGVYPAAGPGDAPAWTDEAYAAYPPTAVPGPYLSGYHPGWVPPPSVPNNLASASVPDDERALEIKLIWGNSVLDTVTATDRPAITMGDERRVEGFGPLQKVARCDLEVPSRDLPTPTFTFAERQGDAGTTYLLHLPPGLVGRVERADGMVIPLELLYQGEHGGERDGAGGARYLLRAEETLYLGYGHLVLQARYVRRTQLAPVPFFSRINYAWANTLILAMFFHVVAITSFVATPEVSADLTDELFKNRNRFIETRLKLAEKKKDSGGGLLDELKKGPGEKAKKAEGKAGKRDSKKVDGKMASKGKPDDEEQARRALDKLLGLGGKGRAAGIFGGSGLGGDLKSAMGGLRGRRVGDARGLGGLGTRGTGPGGGGLSMSSVGLGALGTQGRGGGGEGGAGYGSGAASLGGKKERDVEITAGQAVVRGSLSKEIIRRVIRKHQAQIRYCYEKELQRSPGLYGKVATEFVISASGFVQAAKVYQSTMNDAEVERCITAKIRTWRFPKPKGGGIVVVKYPFLFKASG